MAVALPVVPPPIPTLQATSYLIIQYHTNIKGVVGDNNSKYRIFTVKEADKQLGNYMSYNAFPFINSIKLERSWFSDLGRSELIKTLYSPAQLSKFATKALADSIFKSGSRLNPTVLPGGNVDIVKHNINVIFDLIFSSGNSMWISNNKYEINNADWEKSNIPAGPNPLNVLERSGNNNWMVSTKQEGNKVFKVYTITIFLDLTPGKSTLYGKASSKCDAKYNKIREIAHNVPATRSVIHFLWGPNVEYNRKVNKKTGHSIKAPPLYGSSRPYQAPPPRRRSGRGGAKKTKARQKKTKGKRNTRKKLTRKEIERLDYIQRWILPTMPSV